MHDLQNIRVRSEAILKEHKVPLHPNLPILDEISLRSPREVCERIVSLYTLAGLANGAVGELMEEWLIDENALRYLSKGEKEMLKRAQFSEAELNELSWKQESLYALCWCGRLVYQMTWPTDEADLSNVFYLIPPEKAISEFLASYSLRSSDEVVQELDIYYCLHVALEHPELWRDEQTDLRVEVVVERRQALEWVCSESIGWDEVPLDT